MTTTEQQITRTGCTACGHVEERSTISDNMARFTNADHRTDGCLRQVGIEVPIGTEVRLCRRTPWPWSRP